MAGKDTATIHTISIRKCIVINRNTTIRSYSFIGASLLLGIVTANWVKPIQPANSTRTFEQSGASQTAGLGQFVQEPPQRSSFRPEFSSSLKQSHQRSNFFMLRTFHEAIGGGWKSTVQLLSGGRQLALGTVVDSDGWIVTKASQLSNAKEIVCRLFDHREFKAEVVKEVPELDVALIRISAVDLPVVEWEAGIPSRGHWLATTDLKTTPLAVGVVSAGVQRIRKSATVLGVHLQDSARGAQVIHVLPGTGADDAGLRVDDSIFEVNGVEVFTLKSFKDSIATAKGGEVINLGVSRNNKKILVETRLMDLSDELLDETEMEVNGRVSARATNFERVFLHDTVLEPNQCGGPLLNLDGRAVGINIARAGRVTSYALPTDVIKPTVDSMVAQAKLVSRQADSTTLRPIR